MAVQAKSVTRLTTYGDRVNVVAWNDLPNGDSGDPFECPGWSDRSVQIQGTLGVGGTVVIEGSNDGVNYVTLTDPQGNALSFTAVGRIEAISELTRWIRPRVTAGDGATLFDVTLIARRAW